MLTLILSIALPACISGAILIRFNYVKTVEQDSTLKAEGYADFLEAGMVTPLWNLVPDLGAPVIESVFVDKAINSVEVLNEKGETFLDYTHKGTPDTLENMLLVERDIKHNGDYLGKVRLTYSLQKAKDRAHDETRQLSIIIIAQLFFSVLVVSIALRKRIMLPIRKMHDAAHNMSQGDLKTPIIPIHDDELGVLAQQFETMRHALENSFDMLEQRVQRRTQALSDLNLELKGTLDRLQHTQDNLIQSEKLAALGSLVAGVSHELNTPIGNGLTVATTLEDQCKQFDKAINEGITRSAFTEFIDNFQEGVGIVVRNLGQASELVVSFKQIAVDQTSAQRRKFAVRSLMQEAIVTITPAFKRTPYKVKLTCDTEAKLDSYPGPLVQVITNLVNNAVTHGFDGLDYGDVLVSVYEKEGRVCISVNDNGLGIPEENRHKLFDPFFTTKLGEGGSGLGLHITHNIVTNILGGRLDVTSAIGSGTTFTVDIPLEAPQKVTNE